MARWGMMMAVMVLWAAPASAKFKSNFEMPVEEVPVAAPAPAPAAIAPVAQDMNMPAEAVVATPAVSDEPAPRKKTPRPTNYLNPPPPVDATDY